MKKKILLPTDFSDNAWSAAVYALNLFENYECTFYFLNALSPQTPVPEYDSGKAIDVQKELAELKDMAIKANANANHQIETIASIYNLKKAVETAVTRFNIDLVVMGTKGATGTKEMFYGSNTVNVLSKIKKCPVLVVPDEFDYEPPKHIAFPTDFSRSYSEKEMLYLKNLASLCGSKFRIVHVAVEKTLSKNQKKNQEELDRFLAEYEPSFHWLPNYTSKKNAITDFIDETNVNILAMVNYEHSLLDKIIKEPVIKKIGFKPIVPFFVVPN